MQSRSLRATFTLAACDRVVGCPGRFRAQEMHTVMHFTFPGHHLPVGIAKLLEDRNAKSTPEQITVMITERVIIYRRENHDCELDT